MNRKALLIVFCACLSFLGLGFFVCVVRAWDLDLSIKVLDHNPIKRVTVGQRYKAQVPDTLDLADRMALAVNALSNVWRPERQWALEFVTRFDTQPATSNVCTMTDAYLNIPPKFIEALTVCRLASGNTDRLHVDYGVLCSQLSFLGKDWLTYCPPEAVKGVKKDCYSEDWAEGRMLIALSMLAQIDKDPRWVEIGKRKIDRLLSFTREKEGFRYLWKSRYHPGDNPPVDAVEPYSTSGMHAKTFKSQAMAVAYSMGAIGHGAGLFYRVTGYEQARELSGGLSRWALARIFKHKDGHWDFWHFHHSLYALIAICEYGLATNDREILKRVDSCYRWARGQGDSLTGFYPECMPGSPPFEGRARRGGNTAETCEIADMVVLALKLTRAGIGDYWDDVDRWTRNMLSQGQYCDASLIDGIPDSYFTSRQKNNSVPQQSPGVRQRMLGSFWGWMRANEGLGVHDTPKGKKLVRHAVMHCCTANGARTLYYIWDSIVDKENDLVRVNLLLNRASPWLDVDSFLPVEGKVVLHIKNAPKVAVRMPEWCDPNDVTIGAKENKIETNVQGHYVHLCGLKPNDTVSLTFPVPTREIEHTIGQIPYKLTIRGSSVVKIDPAGVAYPLYKNQHTGAIKQKIRFVPNTTSIIW